jgi:hypothetical protein
MKSCIALLKFSFEFIEFGVTKAEKNHINETFVTVRLVIDWKDKVKHAKTVRKIDNI